METGTNTETHTKLAMSESILTPVAAATYKNGHSDWYGAVELDVLTGEPVWKFDATDTEFKTSTLYEDTNGVYQEGFRPASVERLDNGLTLISGWSRGVLVDEDGDVHDTFTHELMNDVHEIQKTKDNTYLVASTGMDTIIEFDEYFNEIWQWNMWEHTMDITRPTDYYPEMYSDADCRDIAGSPDDRYHLNYVTMADHETEHRGEPVMLCSALNYGAFLVGQESGNILCKNMDLHECHNPTYDFGTYVVSESGNDRVVRIYWDEIREVLFDGDLSFVKDADRIDRDGNWLLTDAKNDRLLVWNVDDDEPKKEFQLPESSHPYESDYLIDSKSFA